MIRVGITDTPIRVPELLDWAKTPQAGAVVSFSGTTRDSFDGKHVKALSYDAHVELATKTLRHIAEKAQAHPDVHNVAVIHRIGLVPLAEESILIVVASGHRRAGWDTAEMILEEVKAKAEIWKREEYDDGSNKWVEGHRRQLEA